MNKRSLIAKHFIILFLPLALAAQRLGVEILLALRAWRCPLRS